MGNQYVVAYFILESTNEKLTHGVTRSDPNFMIFFLFYRKSFNSISHKKIVSASKFKAKI